jgi:RHS repeat-associated protein
LIAEYDTYPVPAVVGGGVSYITSDQLGSSRVVTDKDKKVKARHDYLPFGEEITGNIGSRTNVSGYNSQEGLRQKFTSKERDTESGLDYFGARYYSSVQGRFTSPDEFAGGPDELFEFAEAASGNPTFYADLHNPQSLNKYQYCYNNPLKYVDPNGHDPGDDGDDRSTARKVVDTVADVAVGALRGFAASMTGELSAYTKNQFAAETTSR